MRTFTWTPSYNSDETPKHRTITNSFGDGYEQSMGDGINSEYSEWSLVFDSTSDVIQQIYTFLRDHKGREPFLWTPPGRSTPVKVKCAEYPRRFNAYNHETITAKFEQKFGV